MDNPTYQNKYIGFVTIEFIDVETGDTICKVREDSSVNNNCFREINKRIDTKLKEFGIVDEKMKAKLNPKNLDSNPKISDSKLRKDKVSNDKRRSEENNP